MESRHAQTRITGISTLIPATNSNEDKTRSHHIHTMNGCLQVSPRPQRRSDYKGIISASIHCIEHHNVACTRGRDTRWPMICTPRKNNPTSTDTQRRRHTEQPRPTRRRAHTMRPHHCPQDERRRKRPTDTQQPSTLHTAHSHTPGCTADQTEENTADSGKDRRVRVRDQKAERRGGWRTRG